METTLTHAQTLAQIETALDTIRDYLKADGGNVRVHALTDEGVVQLELLGTCSGCSMSEMTMKAGIEQAILKAVPGITSVVTVNPEA